MLIDFLEAPPTTIPKNHPPVAPWAWRGSWLHTRQQYEENRPVYLAPGVYALRGLGINHPLVWYRRSSHYLLGWSSLSERNRWVAETKQNLWGTHPYGVALDFKSIRPWVLNNCPHHVTVFVQPVQVQTLRSSHVVLYPDGSSHHGNQDLYEVFKDLEQPYGWMFRLAALEPHENPLPEEDLLDPRFGTPEDLLHKCQAAYENACRSKYHIP